MKCDNCGVITDRTFVRQLPETDAAPLGTVVFGCADCFHRYDDSIDAMKYATGLSTIIYPPVSKTEFIDKCRKLLDSLGSFPPLKFPTMEQIRENCSPKKEEPKTATFYKYERLYGLLKHVPTEHQLAVCHEAENYGDQDGWVARCSCGWTSDRYAEAEADRLAFQHRAIGSRAKRLIDYRPPQESGEGIAKLPLRPVRDNSVSILLEDLVAADEE